jgi:hypothetical protein
MFLYFYREESLPDNLIDKKYSIDQLAQQRKKRQADKDGPLTRYSPEANDQINSVANVTTAPPTSTTTPTSNHTEKTFMQVVVHDTKIVIPNLGHFKEYNIEVRHFGTSFHLFAVMLLQLQVGKYILELHFDKGWRFRKGVREKMLIGREMGVI